LKISDTSSKAPSRKRRNLKTCVTVNKQKKEIKDQKTFIKIKKTKSYLIMVTCAVNLKYIIVKVYCEWLKKTEAETGIFPEKGKKSSAVSVFKSLYPEAFTSTVKQTVPRGDILNTQ
jgi:hypothetical protein